jgi:LruC domain-containing protein
MKNFIIYVVLVASTLMLIYQCQKKADNDSPIQELNMEDLNLDQKFNFSTTKDLRFNITALDNSGDPISNIPIELLIADFDKSFSEFSNEKAVFKAFTNDMGQISGTVSIASAINALLVGSDFVGLPYRTVVEVSDDRLIYTIGGQRGPVEKTGVSNNSTAQTNYNTLGSWSASGVPFYLEAVGDVIDATLLADINASLPEGTELPLTHPNYFGPTLEYGLYLQTAADVYVTFVHEGAGWTNTLGFYYYNVSSPPASVVNITNETIIFPNVSFAGSGGGLYAGDKVHIGYFPAGTVIQWFLVAQGWSNTNSALASGAYTHYSQSEFNIESTASLRQHNVLLYDQIRDIFLLGFEDIDRESWQCDQDFNDAVFLATVSPSSSVNTTGYPPLDSTGDADNDGVDDIFDDYPNDPDRAYDIYAPADGSFGTLTFEDQWPNLGDNDYNDIVVRYHYAFVSNANNELVELRAKHILHASGASFENGFGVEYPISPSSITSVTGGDYTDGFFSLSANGTEAGQTNAVIPVFDNAYNILSYPGSGLGINTSPGAPYVQPDTITQLISFGSVLTISDFGTAPYNPFIVSNKDRGREIHLPDKQPTDLVNSSYFGTEDDASNPATDYYYKTSTGLPWAMNLPVPFDYPSEKSPINDAHLKFNDWAQSAGLLYPDWYLDNPGYRNAALIY